MESFCNTSTSLLLPGFIIGLMFGAFIVLAAVVLRRLYLGRRILNEIKRDLAVAEKDGTTPRKFLISRLDHIDFLYRGIIASGDFDEKIMRMKKLQKKFPYVFALYCYLQSEAPISPYLTAQERFPG